MCIAYRRWFINPNLTYSNVKHLSSGSLPFGNSVFKQVILISLFKMHRCEEEGLKLMLGVTFSFLQGVLDFTIIVGVLIHFFSVKCWSSLLDRFYYL